MATLASLSRDRYARRPIERDSGTAPPLWGSPEWNAANDPRQAANAAYFTSPEWQRYVEANNASEHSTSTPDFNYLLAPAALIGGVAAGGLLGAGEAGAGASEGVAGGLGEGSASTAATGVTPAATAGIGGGDTGLMAGATTGASAPLSAAQDPLGSGGDPGNATAGSSSGRAGAGTAMSRILDGTASTADWLSFGGNLASTGLGVAGSRNAVNAFRDLNDRYMAIGAPSRGRYEASMTPGFDPSTIPGYSGAVDTASKGILARLAATGGNPWGNPGGLIEANKQIISGTALPAIQDYQRLNAGTGGYAGFNAAAPGAATAGIGANAGVYNAVGSGLAGLLNPQPSLLDTLRGLGVQGLS